MLGSRHHYSKHTVPGRRAVFRPNALIVDARRPERPPLPGVVVEEKVNGKRNPRISVENVTAKGIGAGRFEPVFKMIRKPFPRSIVVQEIFRAPAWRRIVISTSGEGWAPNRKVYGITLVRIYKGWKQVNDVIEPEMRLKVGEPWLAMYGEIVPSWSLGPLTYEYHIAEPQLQATGKSASDAAQNLLTMFSEEPKVEPR